MFQKIKNFFKSKPVEVSVPESEPIVQEPIEPPKPKKPRKPKEKKVEPSLTPKELATQNNEPYISIVKIDIDPADINNGAFELDWNDKFVLNLIRAGYKIRNDDSDQQVVDRWFQTVCRNIALEIYEQDQADPENRSDLRVIRSRDIGNGRTEVS
jgi:hypothetical protein